jgi:hypothetical protein
LAIAHCALPIELQGKGLGKNFPAKQWAMWNWRWAMSIRSLNAIGFEKPGSVVPKLAGAARKV